MQIFSSCFLALVAVTLLLTSGSSEALVVRTANGDLNGGGGVSRQGREFYSFVGVPYAQPPLGQLRFEPPQAPQNWTGVRQATSYGSTCIQGNGNSGSEDCLYLNVFSPKIGANFSETPLPVIFYIHGGGFSGGASNGNDPDYFMDEDVILVTTNYRVHSMGFLNTNDGQILGNMGLKDLAAGLKWVQTNIGAFGGDKNRVTIFGHSAGGAAVSYLLLSPSTKDLFHKASSRSGVATKIWSFQPKPEEQAVLLASRLGCPTEDRRAMVQCLKSADAKEITRLSNLSGGAYKLDLEVFLPSIEVPSSNAFLTKHPYDVIKDGEAHRVPWINGVNSAEGSLYINPIRDNQNLKNGINANWTSLAPTYLYYDKSFRNVTEKINQFYFGSANPQINFDSQFDQFMKLWTDRYYIANQWNTGMMQAQYSPVYFYYNDFYIDNPTVGHGAEMGYYFPSSSWFIGPNSPFYSISIDIVKLWAEFATTNGTDLHFRGNTWRPIDLNSGLPIKYLQFTYQRPSIIVSEPLKERMQFWDSLGLYRIEKYQI